MRKTGLSLIIVGMAMTALTACDPELERAAAELGDGPREASPDTSPPRDEAVPSVIPPVEAPVDEGDPMASDAPAGGEQGHENEPADEPPLAGPGPPASAPDPAPGLGADCPVDVFYDVSNVAGAGNAYPMPSVEVTCTDDTINVVSNGIPHYAFQAVTPNALQAQNHNWSIPRHPVLVDEMTDVPLLGLAAFSINGLSIYGPNEGPFPDPYGDPIYNDIMDWCQGHTGPNGDYHYHALSESCFFDNPALNTASPILGFALDGFPIYGPRGCVDADCGEVVTFESSWRQSGDPTTYAWDNYTCDQESCAAARGNQLDRCNGRIGPDGTYRYHATDTFPYIIGCYHGDVSGAGNVGGGAPGGGQGPGGGQAPGGGPPDGDQMGGPGVNGPPSCEVEADCDDACPPDAVGCTCADSPRGRACLPECDVNADCDGLAPIALFCGDEGICVPGR